MELQTSKKMLEQKIYFLPEQRLVYLSNAKAGCSTIKSSMWKSISPKTFNENVPPHNKKLTGSPFSPSIEAIAGGMDGFVKSSFFTVVRNPYTRVVSAYLDKVMREKRDQAVWVGICNRFGLKPNSRPSLLQCLQMFSDENPSLLDQHFAPQYVNTLYSYVECDFVGHLENLSGLGSFLKPRGVTISSFQSHSTSANEKTSEVLGSEEIELIQKIYARDFETFGYSDNPEINAPVSGVMRSGIGKDRLINLVKFVTADPQANVDLYMNSLHNSLPEHDMIYSQLERGSVEPKEINALVNSINSGAMKNWSTIFKVSEFLIRRGDIRGANNILTKAVQIMDGTSS